MPKILKLSKLNLYYYNTFIITEIYKYSIIHYTLFIKPLLLLLFFFFVGNLVGFLDGEKVGDVETVGFNVGDFEGEFVGRMVGTFNTHEPRLGMNLQLSVEPKHA